MNINLEERRVIVIDGIEYPILYDFEVLHSGWELDNEAFIIKFNGENRLVWSNHNNLYLVDKTEDRTLLDTFIHDYNNAIDSTKTALDKLEEE